VKTTFSLGALLGLLAFFPQPICADEAPLPATPAAQADPEPYRDDQMSREAYDLMLKAQDEALNLDFKGGLKDIEQSKKLAPGHPLPLVMEVGIRLFDVQEDLDARKMDKTKIDDFFSCVNGLIAMGETREKAHPKSPYPKVYLGAAYGCRGLVNLYQHNYLTSYWDGKKGVDYLHQAQAIDATIYNADMGLGQFDYYCGRLSGILQFVLSLKGDEKRGIATLATCVAKGTYGVEASSVFLAKVLTEDQQDWAQAEPYVLDGYARYPLNYHQGYYLLLLAKGLGLDTEKGRGMMEKLCAQWDSGFRPPVYARYPLEKTRLELAQSYLASKDTAKAKAHLLSLQKSKDSGLSDRATQLLKGLP
jgi:hypothetical protein